MTRVKKKKLRVQDFGFRLQGLGNRVQVFGISPAVKPRQGVGFRLRCSGVRGSGPVFKVSCFGYGYRVHGLRFRVHAAHSLKSADTSGTREGLSRESKPRLAGPLSFCKARTSQRHGRGVHTRQLWGKTPGGPTPPCAGCRAQDFGFHVATLIIHRLGFNQNYYTFSLILLIKIVLCCKFH